MRQDIRSIISRVDLRETCATTKGRKAKNMELIAFFRDEYQLQMEMQGKCEKSAHSGKMGE